jgi:hypothetical protein
MVVVDPDKILIARQTGYSTGEFGVYPLERLPKTGVETAL